MIDITPAELDPLYEEIDPDAIDQLFVSQNDESSPSTLLRPSVAGWRIFLRGDRSIRVYDPDRLTDPAPVFIKGLSD